MTFENSERSVTVNVSASNIEDQVAAFLYAIKVLKSKDQIIKLEIPGLQGVIPIRITFREEGEVIRKSYG